MKINYNSKILPIISSLVFLKRLGWVKKSKKKDPGQIGANGSKLQNRGLKPCP